MDLIAILESVAQDPWAYVPLLLAYSVATTVLLPIPEELGLLNPYIPWWVLVLTVAVGKTIGAVLVFPAGHRLEAQVSRWIRRWPWLARWYGWVQRGVGRFGYWALYALLSIPLMTDTAPVYAFTILNPPEGPVRMRLVPFAAVNFLAGATRGLLFLAGPLLLVGWK